VNPESFSSGITTAAGLLGCAGLFLLAYTLRVIPHRLSPHGLGIDHWYWKSYIEEYRRTRRFPPELPQYVLEQAQWYPPLFALLMAKLPAALFDRFSAHVAIVIDLVRMLFLLLVAAWQTNGHFTVILVAGLVYATTPILVSYNVQLNPRGLAALTLDALLVTLLWTNQGGPWWAWAAACLLGGLILLTHKMTTQLFWFLILGTAAIYRQWEVLLIIPGAVAAALVISRGFYANVMRAHWDIVSFWSRNWRWVGADQVRESPVYGDGRYQRPEKLHKPGMRGIVWHCFLLFGFHPAAWVSCLLVYERLFVESPLLIYPTPFLVWLLLTCMFAFLTTFVRPMKCLGAGYLYVYNTSLLASLIAGLTFTFTRAPVLSSSFLALVLVLNVAGLVVYYRQTLRNSRTRLDDGLMQMIDELTARPRGVVFCIPSQWSEVVAYRTGLPVLWGGHGYGFKLLEPTFPRLLLPIGEIAERYGVKYLLTMDELVSPAFQADLPEDPAARHGKYLLYDLADLPSRWRAARGAEPVGAAV
jgi:hypothetical protein